MTRMVHSGFLPNWRIASLMVLLSACPSVLAQHEVNARITQQVQADSARLVGIFKDLHQHPELGFQETRTAAIVAKELKALGYDVKTGIGTTGVVGILKNGTGPTIMFRADMDCNAVAEVTGLPYASKERMKRTNAAGAVEEVPVMHACGHDAHTTWLLGIAKVMGALKADWKGTLVLVAQPAEEPGLGAEAMIADSMYKQGVPVPDELLAMHTAPFPLGVIVKKPGDLMAGCDQLDVTFHGIGGHGSMPHMTKDPVLMAATAVVQYQFIVSRAIDPQKAAVLTVGSIQAGDDNNVIPASALVKLNLRWYDVKDRELMLRSIARIDSSIAFAYDMPKDRYPELTMKGMAYPVKNDPDMAARSDAALIDLLGEKNIIREITPVMGSEDFHHLVIHNPTSKYLMINVGTAPVALYAKAAKEGKQFPFTNHNPDYQVDLGAVTLGTRIGASALMGLFTTH